MKISVVVHKVYVRSKQALMQAIDTDALDPIDFLAACNHTRWRFCWPVRAATWHVNTAGSVLNPDHLFKAVSHVSTTRSIQTSVFFSLWCHFPLSEVTMIAIAIVVNIMLINAVFSRSFVGITAGAGASDIVVDT